MITVSRFRLAYCIAKARPREAPFKLQASRLLLSPLLIAIRVAMPSTHFSYASEELRDLAASILDYAKTRGATSAEAEVSEGFGQTVDHCGASGRLALHDDDDRGDLVILAEIHHADALRVEPVRGLGAHSASSNNC